MKSDPNYRGWIALAVTGLCITAIWGIVLPALAQTEVVREREAFLEANRINPAAMFYTELECLDADK
ncbi:hypothetical protein C5Y96_04295 [Blastopirellula marina]|uniref:Uncharacterized protein n=1 Tax=Blastopirellula marina TaxID=124 RepID=A0A2S8G3R4_9BACT|nr:MULTISPECIES: hypothetical protein [Pirellulaceae]PQO39088.1 hypothetical protein C5Y96_04295 [Blastopirellula marina]RCS55396.1 hypothetical protein DTL36_04305 [Bremerella cremea]